jgi:hypothetical protein
MRKSFDIGKWKLLLFLRFPSFFLIISTQLYVWFAFEDSIHNLPHGIRKKWSLSRNIASIYSSMCECFMMVSREFHETILSYLRRKNKNPPAKEDLFTSSTILPSVVLDRLMAS